jgi:enoyl-[acyl-carrier-protein] reductase (NADH)
MKRVVQSMERFYSFESVVEHAEDVANLTLFLASDMSAYITGQCINVCGGMLT